MAGRQGVRPFRMLLFEAGRRLEVRPVKHTMSCMGISFMNEPMISAPQRWVVASTGTNQFADKQRAKFAVCFSS